MKENKRLVPKRRFKEFENSREWEERKLGELGSVVMNKRIFKNQTSEVGDVPFYKIGTFGKKPDAYISRELFEKYKMQYQYPKVGDILISASGSIGRTVEYVGKDEYFQDSNIVWLKHEGQLNNLFLKQFYKIVKWEGLEGSTIKRLYNKNILDTKINLPSLSEQEKIGTFFKKLDTLITLQQQKLNKVKALKSAYLSDLFPKEGEKYPKLRFDGFTEPWEERKLSELGKTQSGIGFSESEQGGTDGFPFFKVSDMNNPGNEHEMKTANNYVSLEQLKHWKWKPIEDVPAVIFAKVGAAIMLNRKRLVRRPFLIDNNTMAYIFNDSWNEEFGKTLFETIPLPRYVQVGALPSYNGSDIEAIEVCVPVREEQTKIAELFVNLDNLITLHQRKLKKLQNIKKAYLNELFI